MTEDFYQKGFSCDQCSACCRTHRVLVTGVDLVRLLASSPQEESVIESLQLLGPEDIDLIGEPESLALVREGRRAIALRHTSEEACGPTRQASQSGCVFLKNSQGCSIHQSRPTACRAYPFDRPDPASLLQLGLHPASLCPPDTNATSTMAAPCTNHSMAGRFKKWVINRDQEASDHALWIESWNRHQKTRLRLGRLPQRGRELLEAFLLSATSMGRNGSSEQNN